jgi:hypothetical protein
LTIQELQAILQNQINSTGQVIVNDATLETTWVDELLQEVFTAASISVTQPSLSTPAANSITLSGLVSLFGVENISVTLTFEIATGTLSFTLQATFPLATSFTLSAVATQIFGQGFPVPQNLASFDFSGLSLTFDTSARSMVLGGQASAQLDILGDGKFLLDQTALSVTASYPSGGRMTAGASLAGTLTLAGANFDVAADVTEGISFTAALAEGQSISLSAMSNALISTGITLPFPDISIAQLAASFDTSDGTYSFQTGTSFTWVIPVGSPSIQAQATVKISGTKSTAATGTLDGTLTIGPAAFALTYTLGPDSDTLAGVWQANGKSLGYLSLAAALGIPANDVSLPSDLPDLGLKSATLTIDFNAKSFILAAASTTYGEAFFVASDDSGWGFALGIALPSPWRFGSLPDPVGSDLSPLDFLDFNNAYFIISSLNDPGFSFADFPPLAGSKVSLVPGLTFGSQVDLSGAASGTIEGNLQAVLGRDTLTVQATIGTDPAQTQLSAGLSGQPIPILPFNNLTLDNPQLVIDASPLSVSFDGTFSLPLEGQPLDVETTLEISAAGGTFSAEATTPGGITAPFGFTGVTLEEIGLTGGVAFAPPGVSIGLNGVFKIGSDPADSFALVLVLEGEVINPVLLYGNFNDIAFAPIFDAVFAGSVTLPSELRGLKLEKLYVCWAEPGQTNKLPDGSTPPPGFGLNGLLDVTPNFQASASLQISLSTSDPNISGSAGMSPLNIGNGAVTVTGKSSLGGAEVEVSTNVSPYLKITLDVNVLKLVGVDLFAQVGDGLIFDLIFTIAGQSQTFNCQLRDSQSFSANASLNFPLKANIGPVTAPGTGLNLGTVNVNEQFSGSAAVSISHLGISGHVSGSFGSWTLPTINLTSAVTDLSDMFSMIVNQIEGNARSVFSDLFSNATTWLKAVASGLVSGVGDIVAVGNVLVKFFGESVPQAAALIYNNFTQDLSQMVQLLFGLGASANDAYNILVGLGYSATDVANAVAGVFHTHVDAQPVGHADSKPHGDTGGTHVDFNDHVDTRHFGVHVDTGGHNDTTPHVDGTLPHVDTGHIDVTS